MTTITAAVAAVGCFYSSSNSSSCSCMYLPSESRPAAPIITIICHR